MDASATQVVGSGPVLGDWDGMKGIQLAWTEGDVWRAQVPLESGHYEFKASPTALQARSLLWPWHASLSTCTCQPQHCVDAMSLVCNQRAALCVVHAVCGV